MFGSGALRRALACAALALGAATAPASAQPGSAEARAAGAGERIALTPAEMRGLTGQALRAGQPEVAAALADALLERDGADLAALLARTEAALAMARFEEALGFARRAFAAAGSGPARYAAARYAAFANAALERDTRAQIWLRRARQAAPDDRTRASVAEDYRFLRARNPWAFDFAFSVAPNSNVNDGSSATTISIEGLPVELELDGAARPLSGLEFYGRAFARHRFDRRPDRTQDVTFRFSHRTYLLSPDAKEQAPDVEGSDFAYTTLDLGYSLRLRADGPGYHDLRAQIGRSWYYGEAYARSLDVDYTRSRPLEERTVLRYGGGFELQRGDSGPDADRLNALVGISHRTEGGYRLGLSLAGLGSRSESRNSDYEELRLFATLSPRAPILGAESRFGLGLRARNYDENAFSADGRLDREISGELLLGFPGVEYFGFNPTVALTYQITDSTVDLYDTEEGGITFGLRTAF